MAWKMTKVVPIPKLGKPTTNIINYRLISLLDILDKILEKIIQHHLLENIDKSDIIIPEQFGFRQNHSLIQQHVTEHIIMKKNKNKTT